MSQHYYDSSNRSPITPWGRAQTVSVVMDGIKFYSTAGHGGLRVCTKLQKNIPEVLRHSGGWYEEDCAYAIPFYFNFDAIKAYSLENKMDGYSSHDTVEKVAEHFTKFDKEYYKEKIKRYWTAEWEIITGETVDISKDSYTTREVVEEQKKAILAKMARPVVKSGTVIEFDKPLRFNSGAEFSKFKLVRNNRFFAVNEYGNGSYLVKITGWKKMDYKVSQ